MAERPKLDPAWVEAQIDGILQARVEAALSGPFSREELRYAVEMARTEAILTARTLLVLDADPIKTRAAVQAFQALHDWVVADGAAGGAARARPVTQRDVDRVTRMIQAARGG